jgi:peptidoglycan/LPS O-acetylase OafA/YrhL
MAVNEDKVGTGAKIAVLVVLGIVALVFALPGAIVYWAVVEDWAGDPRGFHGIDGAINWLFGVCATGAIAAGIIIIGVMLRLLRWRRAPLASLALSVLSTAFIIATYLIFSDTNTSPDSIEVVFLQGCCIVLLLLVALPPFLHWAMNKPENLPVPTEPRP